MTDLRKNGTQAVLVAGGGGALSTYADVVVGNRRLRAILKYELVTSLFGNWPGVAGLALRRIFYRGLFRRCGRQAVIGRNVTLRHPHRITLGDRVVIGDGCTLDAKGRGGEGIVIRDNVFLGTGSILSMAGGGIEIDEGANIGSYCRIGTFGRTRIGKKALLAAYCYVVGATHRTDRLDIPILDQPNDTKGGAVVGDGTWLGARVTVLDGVTVGRDAIVGAHAVVTHDLPDYAVARGIPAKVVRRRTEEEAPPGKPVS